MDYKEIDWPQLQAKQSESWRKVLPEATLSRLISSDGLADYNEEGYFHDVPEMHHYQQMQENLDSLGRVEPEWISKGNNPGIWIAMFHPCNTRSQWNRSLHIVRFYFKEGYKVFDGRNAEHQQLHHMWENNDDPNQWKDEVNAHGESLEQRLKIFRPLVPTHKKFYEDHKFAAIIGYSDYDSLVILLEDSIEKVEFFEY